MLFISGSWIVRQEKRGWQLCWGVWREGWGFYKVLQDALFSAVSHGTLRQHWGYSTKDKTYLRLLSLLTGWCWHSQPELGLTLVSPGFLSWISRYCFYWKKFSYAFMWPEVTSSSSFLPQSMQCYHYEKQSIDCIYTGHVVAGFQKHSKQTDEDAEDHIMCTYRLVLKVPVCVADTLYFKTTCLILCELIGLFEHIQWLLHCIFQICQLGQHFQIFVVLSSLCSVWHKLLLSAVPSPEIRSYSYQGRPSPS